MMSMESVNPDSSRLRRVGRREREGPVGVIDCQPALLLSNGGKAGWTAYCSSFNLGTAIGIMVPSPVAMASAVSVPGVAVGA